MKLTLRAIMAITVIMGSVFVNFALNDVLYAQDFENYFRSKGLARDLEMFMKFRAQMNDRIRDRRRKDIHFAIGEYYLKNNVYREARLTFESFVNQYPSDERTLLAKVFLYKLAQKSQKEEQMSMLQEDIFKEQFILLFEEFKILYYESHFDNEYEIRYYIDKIEVNINGKPFAVVTPASEKGESQESDESEPE